MGTATLATAKDLAGRPGRCELVHGEIIDMSPAGEVHGYIVGTISIILGSYIRQHRLGRLYGAETGFLLERDPDTVRAPDVAFVRQGRVASDPSTTFAVIAPDLVVEVLSPSDAWSAVEAKVEWWLAKGVAMVWIVDPATKRVDAFTPGSRTTLHERDRIDGGTVLPGFACPVADLFA